MSDKRPNQGKLAKDLNDTIRYTMWSVFKLRDVLGDGDRAAEAARSRSSSRSSPATTSSCAASTTSPACAPTPT